MRILTVPLSGFLTGGLSLLYVVLLYMETSILIKKRSEDLPGGLVVNTLHFQCRGEGLTPGW